MSASLLRKWAISGGSDIGYDNWTASGTSRLLDIGGTSRTDPAFGETIGTDALSRADSGGLQRTASELWIGRSRAFPRKTPRGFDRIRSRRICTRSFDDCATESARQRSEFRRLTDPATPTAKASRTHCLKALHIKLIEDVRRHAGSQFHASASVADRQQDVAACNFETRRPRTTTLHASQITCGIGRSRELIRDRAE